MRLAVWIAAIGTASILLPSAGHNSAAQEPTVTSQPVTLPGTEQFDLKSKSGETYRIFVAGPKEVPLGNGAPVIYLSDGNSNFPVVLAAAQKQARAGLQVVVVGIGYPTDDQDVHRRRRSIDLTPKTSPEWIKANAPQMGELETGGNDQFLAFIEDELKPVIERKFRVDRSRQTLFGHSFGGLFVLHALFTKPDSFQTYVASSPSIWWNGGSARQQAAAFAEKNSGKTFLNRLFISVGSLEQRPGPGGPMQRAPSGEQRSMSAVAKEFADSLKNAGVHVEFREFAEENHGSVVLPAASRGVRFALEDKAEGPSPANSGNAKAAAATRELNLPAAPVQYRDELPAHFLTPAAKAFDDTPRDNPITDEGALLGRVLFYDMRLSANGTISCASCHQQQHAFTDARRVSRGHAGEKTDRNSMSLVNLRFSKAGKFWDEREKTLEEQVLIPLQSRVEMGQSLDALVTILQEDDRYPKLLESAFGDSTISSERIAKALSQFLRSLVSYRSKYDAGLVATGDESKDFSNFTASENHGKSLFLEKCAICHRDGRGRQSAFFTSFRSLNNGVDATADVADGGAGDITLIPSDIGLFRPSDLRNVEFTAPYMHDGRFATLEEVLEHYSTGVQHHPTVSGFVFRMQFSDEEKAAIVDFLKTLSDEAFLNDPRYSNPWNDAPAPQKVVAENHAAAATVDNTQSDALTTDERAQRLAERSGLPRGEARNYLRDLDQNGDEALSLEETKPLAELLLEIGPPARFDRRRFTTREMRVNLGEEGPPPVLMAYDKDKDGRLSAIELPEPRRHLLNLADLNGDGSLDRNEAAKFETVERFLTLQVNDRDRTRMVRLVESLKLDDKEYKQAMQALRDAQAELQRRKAALDTNVTEQLQSKLGPRVFARFQDLLLSKQDAVALARRSGGDSVDSMRERIFEFDDNHDKELNRQELDALAVILDETQGGFGTKRLPLPTTEQYAGRIMARDADGDGFIAIDEVPERLRFLFDRGDADGDQRLTRAELDDCLRNTAYQRFLAEGVYVGGGFVNAFTQSGRLLDELELDDDVKSQARELLDAHERSIQASIDKSVSDQYRRLRDALSRTAASAASR